MNLSTKYNFKTKWDQFGNIVPENYCDLAETDLNIEFDKCIDEIKNKKEHHIMIELGSNQAYYSCVFKAALGNKNTTCIMIEPFPHHMDRGVQNFAINNFDGIFINGLVGNGIAHSSFNNTHKCIEIKNIMNDYKIENIDILHCDIDGAEFEMLMQNKDIFIQKKIDWIFLLTHDENATMENCKNIYNNKEYNTLHDVSKQFILDCGYNLMKESDKGAISSDTLLVFKK